MKKDKLFGNGIQTLMILFALFIMYLGGLKFVIISIIFYGIGGLYEFIIMNNFYSKSKEKITKRDLLIRKIKNGLFWVHDIVGFRKRYNTTIYDFKNIGQTSSFVAYLTMNIYVLISYLLFINFSYFGLIIYIVPAITNGLSLIRNYYLIQN